MDKLEEAVAVRENVEPSMKERKSTKEIQEKSLIFEKDKEACSKEEKPNQISLKKEGTQIRQNIEIIVTQHDIVNHGSHQRSQIKDDYKIEDTGNSNSGTKLFNFL